MSAPHEDAALVLALQGGDQGAFAPLFAEWSDRCYDVARRIVRDDGQAAEVTQETFLVAWQQIDTLRNPEAFGGWVLRMARNRALNQLEKERRAVPVAGDAPVLAGIIGDETADQPGIDAMSAADHQALVAAATAALGERDASVLDLHLRHGMGAPEIAEELGVTTNNAHQLLHRMKKRLATGIRAWTLVRGGRPSCEGLADALDAAEVTAFGRDAVTVIDGHVKDCDECTGRQAAMVSPGALFAAAPVVAMTATMRATVTNGLRASGVPLEGPASTPPRTDPDADPDPDTDLGASPDDRNRHRRVLATVAGIVVLLAGVAAGVMAFDRGEDLGPVETASVAPTEAEPTTTTTAGASTIVVAPAPTEAEPAPTEPIEAPLETTQPSVGDQPPAPSPPLVFEPPVASDPTTPPQPTPAAQVGSFTATAAVAPGGACGGGQWATTLTWTTSDATSVRITASGEPDRTGLAPNGSVVACRPTPSPPPGGWTLTATGPGGQDTASA